MKTTIATSWLEEIEQRLSTPCEITLVGHQNPDGDAVGGGLALFHFLRKQGHKVSFLLPNSMPAFLHWIPGASEILIFDCQREESEKRIVQAEIIFAVDFNCFKRSGEAETFLRNADAYKVLIDHHPDPEPGFDYLISDTSVSSASELVYEFLIRLKAKHLIDRTIAECLFTGIMADTGSFSYNSSQPRTFSILSELIDYGVEKEKISHKLYDNYSQERMRLMGYCLSENMRVFTRYRTACICLSKSEMQRYHYKEGDSEGFVNLPLSIRGVVFTALFTEKDGYVKTSFRSRGSFDVNAFSRKHFGGGGHTNAAGGRFQGTLPQAVGFFESLLPQYTNQLAESEV